MMKKKVKKIPKYSGGIAAAGKSPDLTIKSNPAGDAYRKQMQDSVSGASSTGSNLPSGIATASNELVTNVLGIEDNSREGVTLNAAATGSDIGGSIMPGWGHLIGAVAGGLVGSFKQGSVDPNTGEITYGGIFGRSNHSLRSESNRIKNNIRAKTMTQGVQADYYNNPNVQTQPILAAEGGIMRKPVDALVSKGELIYDPTTKKLRQVPGSEGKPNKADDVYAKLYEGDVVISNSPTMLMANGKTPAQNLMGMVDKYATGGTVKAREAIIKKVVNWQEANKTKPQEYAMYDEGTGKVKARKKEKIDYVVWNGKFGYFDAEGGFHDMSDVSNPNLPDSSYLGRYEWVDAPIKKKNVGKHTSTELDFNTSRHTRDGVNDKKSESNWRKSPTQEEIDAFYGYDRKKVSETVVKDRSERINNKNRKYLIENENENEMAGTLPEVVVTAPKINKASLKKDTGKKSSSGKTTATTPQESKLTPEQIAESLRIADIGERHWLRGPISESNQSLAGLAQTTPEKLKIQKLAAPSSPRNYVDYNDSTDFNTNWGDLAYKAASIFTPLFDREKAESVQYQVPIVKYRPTSVNIDPQRRAIDESYAMARYNQANISSNTGAGMAYGLQAATNRAKQLSDVYSWQTNAQNNLIGQNVDTYNKWSADYANIMNNVYDKAAANRATARNINRQNVATALKNWGQIRRDDKAYEMDRMKLHMLDPMLQYGYENYDNYLKWKKENGYG